MAISNATINRNERIELLDGQNEGTIEYCSSGGSASGSRSIGGLVGNSVGTIQFSFSTANAIGTGLRMEVGGLVGKNEAAFEKLISHIDTLKPDRIYSSNYFEVRMKPKLNH